MNNATDSQGALTPASRNRRRGLAAVAAVVILAGIGYGTWYALVGRQVETTDNAYVQGDVVQITPQVGGTVLAIQADDTDTVHAGQLLVKLDTTDAQVALDQAEAQLARTVREVRTLFANNAALTAQIALREADLARARADLARAADDVARRTPLVTTGAVGREEFEHANAQLQAARSAVAAAEAAVAAAREQLASNQALTDGITVEQHPSVLAAAAKVREAFLALKRSELLAPVDGVVARRSVQVGQRVQAGTPLMAIVPLQQVWVDANFKESQLQRLRIGQPVTLTADVYGDKVEYRGKVEGLSAGTGAAFALLPAQNATGNWIKVVQRVPVRISLDPAQLAEHPLRVGLSMEARVDVSDTSGKVLAEGGRSAPVAHTAVFDRLTQEADERVQRIIETHLGRPARQAAARQPSRPAAGGGVPAHVAAAAH